MVTLQQIHDKLDDYTVGGLLGVPKTGQSKCYDESGAQIACAGTGQDGEYRAGFSIGPRFTVNGDGTVTHNLTGLIWLQDAGCLGARIWTDALSDASTLTAGFCGLADGSVAGDWRLPNVRELNSLIDYGEDLPALPPDHPFSGVQTLYYWTSSSREDNPYLAWGVQLRYGGANGIVKDNTNYVWPVRGGR